MLKTDENVHLLTKDPHFSTFNSALGNREEIGRKIQSQVELVLSLVFD